MWGIDIVASTIERALRLNLMALTPPKVKPFLVLFVYQFSQNKNQQTGQIPYIKGLYECISRIFDVSDRSDTK